MWEMGRHTAAVEVLDQIGTHFLGADMCGVTYLHVYRVAQIKIPQK